MQAGIGQAANRPEGHRVDLIVPGQDATPE